MLTSLLQGIARFGIQTAAGIARYGFGEQLLRISYQPADSRAPALAAWRSRFIETLRKDPRGLIGRQHPALANTLPITFPDLHVYELYRSPAVMTSMELKDLQGSMSAAPRPIDFARIVEFGRGHFWWKTYKDLGSKMMNLVVPGVLMRTAVLIASGQTVSTLTLISCSQRHINQTVVS